ncbi:MAG: hypothetical protein L3K10_02495 [Thermoplasmata archaeon]|jgi:hypothetical protein|nr:hypothetical protein [Thermoplasmata archaeon]
MIGNWLVLVAFCLGLGMVHGVIPDEHTWPITFNYAVGAASSRGGRRAGMWFSLAFTVQRAIMSEFMFLAFALVLAFDPAVNGPVYLAVGVAMALAGWLILTGREKRFLPHMAFAYRGFKQHQEHEKEAEKTLQAGRDMPVHWCLIHGFISGFGQDSGIFTIAVFVAAIASPSFAVGWVPGAAFGVGTFAVLMLIGMFFGGALDVAGRWGKRRVARFGQLVGARSLVAGGLVFVVAGALFILGFSALIEPVIDFGTLIVVFCMIGATVPIIVYTWRQVKNDRSLDLPPPPTEPPADPRASTPALV